MFFHFVKNGDTLYKISKQYSVPLNTLIKDNNLEEPYLLLVGECLIIRDKKTKDRRIENKIINGFCYQGISTNTLNEYLPTLTHTSIFAYRLNNDGHLLDFNSKRIINRIKEYDKQAMLTIANIKESGGFSTSLASSILNSNEYQNNLINDLKRELKENNYDSLCIDFEYVNEDEKNLYSSFLRKIKDALPSYPLFVALAPKNSDEQKGLLYTAHDYYQIGKVADYVILMTYEWGYTYGEPQAIAPLNQVKKVIRYAKTKIDNDKIIMGLPNYGYDWNLPYQKNTKADSVSNVEAMKIAKKYKVEIKYDKVSQTPYFNYRSEGKEHIVHFDDACSINQKINLMLDENIKGLSIWTISTYYPQLKILIDYYFDTDDEV